VSFVPGPERAAFRSCLTRVVEGQPRPEWEIELQARQHESCSVAVRVSTVANASGRIIGIRWILRDITARKETERRLSDLSANLESRVEERTLQLESALQAREEALAREARARQESEHAQRRFALLAETSRLLEKPHEYAA